MAKFALALLLSVVAPRDCTPQEVAKPVPSASSARIFGERLKIHGVPNAGKVTEMLYRGGQPRGSGYQELKNLGVSMVVDLRNTNSRSPERSTVEILGMRYVSLPTSAYLGPTDHEVATFLKLIQDNPQQKIFVHCYFGDDRTGVMVASYRIAEEHWTADRAYNEMRFFHFHTYLIPMGHYVKRFTANFAVNPEFTAIRAPVQAN